MTTKLENSIIAHGGDYKDNATICELKAGQEVELTGLKYRGADVIKVNGMTMVTKWVSIEVVYG